MVSKWGMPHFFVTLTADEQSDTRWSEISDLENILKKFNGNFNFSDAPIEC